MKAQLRHSAGHINFSYPDLPDPSRSDLPISEHHTSAELSSPHSTSLQLSTSNCRPSSNNQAAQLW